MKKILICAALLSAFVVNPATAQKKKKRVKAQPVIQLSEEAAGRVTFQPR